MYTDESQIPEGMQAEEVEVQVEEKSFWGFVSYVLESGSSTAAISEADPESPSSITNDREANVVPEANDGELTPFESEVSSKRELSGAPGMHLDKSANVEHSLHEALQLSDTVINDVLAPEIVSNSGTSGLSTHPQVLPEVDSSTNVDFSNTAVIASPPTERTVEEASGGESVSQSSSKESVVASTGMNSLRPSPLGSFYGTSETKCCLVCGRRGLSVHSSKTRSISV